MTAARCGVQGQRDAVLQPSVYFSPRRSPAPDTAGAAAAESAAAGAGATAGAGAAWLWTGAAGQPLDQRWAASIGCCAQVCSLARRRDMRICEAL
jgi:hypothetical protein